ncbi:MAG: peptide chain release factor N(5)-glutamine methyltransferase, partial [Neisseriaceae bacterium]|nr:peptide chain release factor N(5)-glutamine methyltransferase [Neisseriaceae bacterium]
MTPFDSSAADDLSIEAWLRQCGLPRLEARMLMQAATGLTHAQLITRSETLLSAAEQAQLAAWAKARHEGQPMAYLLGEREFYGRLFQVSPSVLIPRPETEHLVAAALAKMAASGVATPKVWDLGTGSGVIAITLALECPKAQVWASDVSVAALTVAQNNAMRLGASVQFKAGSWLDAFVGTLPPYSMDVVVANPPYI